MMKSTTKRKLHLLIRMHNNEYQYSHAVTPLSLLKLVCFKIATT